MLGDRPDDAVSGVDRALERLLEHRFEHLTDGNHQRVAGRLHDALVEFKVEINEVIFISPPFVPVIFHLLNNHINLIKSGIVRFLGRHLTVADIDHAPELIENFDVFGFEQDGKEHRIDDIWRDSIADVGPITLADLNNAHRLKHLHRFPNGAAAHAELFTKPSFRRKPLIGLELSGLKRLLDRFNDVVDRVGSGFGLEGG